MQLRSKITVVMSILRVKAEKTLALPSLLVASRAAVVCLVLVRLSAS